MSPECHWHRFLNKIISTTTASIDFILFVSKVTLALGVRVGSFVTKDISGVAHEGMRGQEVLASAVSLGGTDKGQVCRFANSGPTSTKPRNSRDYEQADSFCCRKCLPANHPK